MRALPRGVARHIGRPTEEVATRRAAGGGARARVRASGGTGGAPHPVAAEKREGGGDGRVIGNGRVCVAARRAEGRSAKIPGSAREGWMATSRAWDARRSRARHAPRAVTLGLAAATRSVARHARDSVWRNMTVLSTRTEVCGGEGGGRALTEKYATCTGTCRSSPTCSSAKKARRLGRVPRSSLWSLRDARPVRSMSGAAPGPPPPDLGRHDREEPRGHGGARGAGVLPGRAPRARAPRGGLQDQARAAAHGVLRRGPRATSARTTCRRSSRRPR